MVPFDGVNCNPCCGGGAAPPPPNFFNNAETVIHDDGTLSAWGGPITIPAGTIKLGDAIYSQVFGHVTNYVSIGRKTCDQLSLFVDGVAISFNNSDPNITAFAPTHTVGQNVGWGLFVSQVIPGGLTGFSLNAESSNVQGSAIGESWSALWEENELAFGAYGVGQGGWTSISLDPTIPHVFEWKMQFADHGTGFEVTAYWHQLKIVHAVQVFG